MCVFPMSFITPENWWLEDEFPFGARPIFKGELLVSGRVIVAIFPPDVLHFLEDVLLIFWGEVIPVCFAIFGEHSCGWKGYLSKKYKFAKLEQWEGNSRSIVTYSYSIRCFGCDRG